MLSVIPVRVEPAGSVSGAPSAADRRGDAERQLSAALDRHHEAVVSMQTLGRPAAGQHVAVKSVARAVHLVAYALKRAADAHVPLERLAERTGWEPDLVRQGIILADVESVAAVSPTPAQVDPADLHDRVEAAWQSWHRELDRRGAEGTPE